MRRAILTRKTTGVEGTFGELATDTGILFVTAELPWRGNEREKSCIPTGTYRCTYWVSPRFGSCYVLSGVPARDGIMIHAGNFSGDRDAGYASDVKGCILVGQHLGKLSGQRAVCLSASAVRQLALEMNREPFELVVEERYA